MDKNTITVMIVHGKPLAKHYIYIQSEIINGGILFLYI